MALSLNSITSAHPPHKSDTPALKWLVSHFRSRKTAYVLNYPSSSGIKISIHISKGKVSSYSVGPASVKGPYVVASGKTHRMPHSAASTPRNSKELSGKTGKGSFKTPKIPASEIKAAKALGMKGVPKKCTSTTTYRVGDFVARSNGKVYRITHVKGSGANRKVRIQNVVGRGGFYIKACNL